MEIIELTTEDLSTVLLVHDTYGRLHATVYAIIVSRKRAGLTTLTVEDLHIRTAFPVAMIESAVKELVHERLLHWTVIGANWAQSRVTVA